MTRSMDLDWKMRAFRVLPMFLLPFLSFVAHSAFVNFTRMCDQKDQKTVERLQAERQAKINELKERTNYYTTQQLIQRYDSDPAAKAAAATVLASKLGADSGLKVYLGDEFTPDISKGKSNDVEVTQSSGLRNRMHVNTRSSGPGSTPINNPDELSPGSMRNEGPQISERNQFVAERYLPQATAPYDGGWIARIAALLVGEDPTQSYALICGNCHMHNGLAGKEDFPFITYFCPHCHTLNQPKQLQEHVSGSDSPSLSTLRAGVRNDMTDNARDSPTESTLSDSSPDNRAGAETEEVDEMVASGEATIENEAT